jgi:hypothetical protein
MQIIPALRGALITASLSIAALTASAGSVFVTGHDPIWHSSQGGNTVGATNLAKTGIDYARDGSALPFLYIESKTTPIPPGNLRTESFLTSVLGYGGQYVVMDAADLSGLADFRTTLDSYSAIVVASDHGGMLGAAELAFLNGHATDIISFLNAGGGLYAEAESNATGMIGAEDPFGFLPFLVTSTSFQAAETSNTVTSFGAGLGLVAGDVNGNFSHNFFSSTGGMSAVDLFNGDPSMPLTLAFRGQIDTGGVVPIPEPETYALMLAGLGALGMVARRRKQAGKHRAVL